MTQLTSSLDSATTRLAPGAMLDDPERLTNSDLSTLHGFGGLHGGLALGLLASAMQRQVGERPLRYVTGQFRRPAAGALELMADAPSAGRTATRAEATMFADGKAAVVATAVFGDATDDGFAAAAPPMPAVATPDRCPSFDLPVDFVPFSQHVQIRPADDNRPFIAGADPTLVAWIRLVEDDGPPDALRLITLLDALAPSYAAVLDTLVAIPTLELSVRLPPVPDPADGVDSPWVLLRATTHSAAGGWLDEHLDAWSPSGFHLGSATQVRLVRS